MKNRTTNYLRVLFVLSLFVLLSVPAFAQNSNVMGTLDYTSMAEISGKADGVNSVSYKNPYTNNSASTYAGDFSGTLNSATKKFYCIDLEHSLAYNEDYWDEGSTPSEITYILNHYFPYKTSYTGKLSDNGKEAAAVQFAIWHFSDGVDANTISNNSDVKTRALAIIADANTNHNNAAPLQSLLILPSVQSLLQGNAASFDVFAIDANNNPIAGLALSISATLGTLSKTSGTTDANGHFGPFTLTYSGTGTATIKVLTNLEIPHGTRYVHKANPNGRQKLVLATPAVDKKETTATVTWYTQGGPGTCDTKGFTTYTQGGWGSPSNSTPGKIRDLYFSTVFPGGLTVGGTFKLTLTSATAVKDYLPDGGTASAYTQNYNNPTNAINILSGQLTALKLNVKFDAAGKIGTNSTNLGDLAIASGPFTGMLVNDFLAFAETAIGGGSLNGFTFSQINDAATAINENFDNGTVDNGFLICGESLKASLGDKVWEDLNKNGLQDGGESGVSNVTVKLYDCNNNLKATTTTNSSGNYLFSNLIPGGYYVEFTLPGGYTFTSKDSGLNDAIDSDADATTGKTICTSLSAGENDMTWDAGIYKECKNKIGDFVWHDANANGVQDTGEKGIAGILIELLQGSTVISTKTTDVNGYYEFANLNNGTYGVRVAASNYSTGGALFNTTQTKWYASPKNQGLDSKDSDANKNETVTVTLSCGDNLTIDFGFYKTCVSITKTTDKQSYNNGETITYSFLVENCGDIQLHGGVDIFDAMLNTSGNHLIKHVDILDPHQSATFTMTYLTSDKDCGQLVNTVRAEGHPINNPVGGASHAAVTDESTWTVTIVCQEKADIKIEKTVDNASPACDDNVTFTIKATNLGPNTASGVVVTDLLPNGLDYVSSTPSQGTYNSATGIWTVGTLANNAFATLTIKVKVDCGQVNNSTFDLGIAKDFNLFVIEDVVQPSSDTQGKVAVGGNATFSYYSVGDQLPANSGDVLIVGNDLTYTSGAIFNGNVVYGHATNLPISAVSITGGTLRKDSPINFASAKLYLENLATTLSGSTANGTTAFQYGGLTLTGSDPYLNVFAVSGANLSSANNISINVPNGSVVLINIGGTTLTWTGGLTVTGTAISNVLFNFYEAATLTIQGIDIRGSVLAPFAAVNFASGVINGQMICKSLTGMGQFNFTLFGGQIPVNEKITNIAAVTGSSTLDPNPANNSSSAMVTINATGNTGGGSTGGNGGGSTGGSWTNVSSFGQGEIVYTLAYSSSAIYAGTWGGKIYKSTDAGKTWSVINSGMTVSFIWSLNISGGVIFAATEQGVYKYNGATWTLTSLSGKDVHSLVSYNGSIYAATWGFGIFKSTNGGTTWTEINSGLGGFLAVQALTITSNGNVFAGTVGGGIFKCTDGSTWTKITSGYESFWSMASTSSAIFAGTYGDGLYRSLDGGLSFTKTSLDITFVYSIAVDLSGKIYVSSLTNGVYVSNDNGTTWSSLGMGGFGVSAMMVNPSSSDVYVGTKEGKLFKIEGGSGTTAVEDNTTMPAEYNLAQNYPNPFNPTTTIQFSVPEAGMYSLKVYNVLGEEVATLVNNQLAGGVHKATFDANKMASGMYIYKLSGNNVNISRKMILMK